MTTPPRLRRTLAATGSLLAAAALLAGCSDDESGDAAPTATPTEAASEQAYWNPCDGLRARPVEKALGARLKVERGTREAPRCTLVPRAEGGAAIDVNYTVFGAGLDEAWEQMGAPDDGSVTEPEVAGADDTRMVVSPGDDALAVTAFVQNGEVVQLVNVVDPTPYDRERVVAAVGEVMSQLSAYAGRSAPQ
jgi:hypothetical protein